MQGRASFENDGFFKVPWDTKILPDLTSSRNTLESIDRLAIVLTGDIRKELLGVPKICNGTGRAQAESVYNCLLDWNVADKIRGLCVDTKASNTGAKMIYSLKIYLYREQFSLNSKSIVYLLHHLYIKHINTCYDSTLK